MSLEENTDKNKNKQFINQNDVIQENEKKEIDTSNLKKNENQFLSSTLSSNKNQDLSKTDLFKFNPIIPDFLLSNNEPNNKYNFFQSKKVSTSDIKESENNNITSEKLCCNCTKTKCVKKYCECYSNNRFCRNCHCVDCMNIPENNSACENGKESLETEKVLCTCAKSNCTKKYCECYKSNQKCTYKCRCVNCKNGVKASFNVNVPESDNIINKESINKDNEIINNIVENNSVDKNEKINLGIGDKNNKKINSRKSSNENNNENKNYQIQRVSVFINKYKTVIDVEKFTKEMMLISKKRKRLKK
jgi:hypothetical protein